MRGWLVIAVVFVTVGLIPSQATAQHYFGGGNAIPLKVDSSADVVDLTWLVDMLFGIKPGETYPCFEY